MTSPRGCYHLNAGIRLIAVNGAGIIVRENPFRMYRVNLTALDLLKMCQTGYFPESMAQILNKEVKAASANLLDRFMEAGVLRWTPPDNFEKPLVTIVVPVYNRAQDIRSCLDSLFALEYPSDSYEIVVIDDNSSDSTVEVIKKYGVKLLENRFNMGQSAARNLGASHARGDIIAFTDSDCIVSPRWLSELIPYFEDERNVLVGGYVGSYYRKTRLDRYEESNSPLNMGKKLLFGHGPESDFYVPTCNMLLRKKAYSSVGGFDEAMRVGEDVDLCWRLKERGFRLVYVPMGTVEHKHRNVFTETFKRRFEYGLSEPMLYSRHRQIEKHFPVTPSSLALMLSAFTGIVGKQLLSIPLFLAILVADAVMKTVKYTKQAGISLPFATIFRSAATTHFNLLFHLSHHVIRYHLILLLLLAIVFPQIMFAVAAMVLFTSIVECIRKKPRISFPEFLFYFLAEQCCYQLGVLTGCLRLRFFRPYKLNFRRVKPPSGGSKKDHGGAKSVPDNA